MANELKTVTASGLTIYCVLLNKGGLVWNGVTFEIINGANWTNYDIAMTESVAGIYFANMPAMGAGAYFAISYDQAGGLPAITDTPVDFYTINWDGSGIVELSDINLDNTTILNLLSTSPSVMQNRCMNNDDLICRKSADFTASFIYLGDLTVFTKLYFTVKPQVDLNSTVDSKSTIQIEAGSGLIYINGGTALNPLNGSITITDAVAGHLTIALDAEETAKLSAGTKYRYDIKRDNTVLAEGAFYIQNAVTLTVT